MVINNIYCVLLANLAVFSYLCKVIERIMNLDEIASRINNMRTLEELERKPVLPYDPSESMETLEEAKSYIRFLYEQLQ